MKVTKSLLLATATGFVALSGAQAADLPVKAKPVEYVKICSAYGAGFYYIPGTDICLRVGGYVFVETGVKGAAAAVNVLYNGTQFTTDDNYVAWRARGHVILDARNNTAYGTLRAYFVGGVSVATPGGNVPVNSYAGAASASIDRAFIQFAGFTAGFTESFFSFGGAYSIVASASLAWDWLPLIAYTAQLGNGVSATLSIEDGAHRRTSAGAGFVGFNSATPTLASSALQFGSAVYGGASVPDIVANLRVDQAWGSAQIMGALHEVRVADQLTGPASTNEFGYAVGGGFEIKTPQTGNPNNSFLVQGAWTKGAIEFTGLAASPAAGAPVVGWNTGVPSAIAYLSDGYVPGCQTVAFPGSNTGCQGLQLTKAWSAYAAYRHYWTPTLRTGFAAGYTEVDVPSAINLGTFNSTGANATGNLLGPGVGLPDVELWQGFVSTIWSPVAGLDLSLDVVYSKVKTKCANPASATTGCFTHVGNPTGAAQIATSNGLGGSGSEDIWTVWTRIRRNF
jgi:hypothetical protein